jgi:hypothetical protein
VKFPTGGIAHEPQGMIRCNSEADSKVWMKEDNAVSVFFTCQLIFRSEMNHHFRAFCIRFCVNILYVSVVNALNLVFKAFFFSGGVT